MCVDPPGAKLQRAWNALSTRDLQRFVRVLNSNGPSGIGKGTKSSLAESQSSENTSETLPRPGQRRCRPSTVDRGSLRQLCPPSLLQFERSCAPYPVSSVDICCGVWYTAMATVLNDRRDMPKRPRRPLYRGCDTAMQAMTQAAELKICLYWKFTTTAPQRSNTVRTSAWCSSARGGGGRPFE